MSTPSGTEGEAFAGAGGRSSGVNLSLLCPPGECERSSWLGRPRPGPERGRRPEDREEQEAREKAQAEQEEQERLQKQVPPRARSTGASWWRVRGRLEGTTRKAAALKLPGVGVFGRKRRARSPRKRRRRLGVWKREKLPAGGAQERQERRKVFGGRQSP